MLDQEYTIDPSSKELNLQIFRNLPVVPAYGSLYLSNKDVRSMGEINDGNVWDYVNECYKNGVKPFSSTVWRHNYDLPMPVGETRIWVPKHYPDEIKEVAFISQFEKRSAARIQIEVENDFKSFLGKDYIGSFINMGYQLDNATLCLGEDLNPKYPEIGLELGRKVKLSFSESYIENHNQLADDAILNWFTKIRETHQGQLQLPQIS